MKINEFPETISGTQVLIEKLTSRAEREPDREKRRELFLLKIELRDHLIQLGLRREKEEV